MTTKTLSDKQKELQFLKSALFAHDNTWGLDRGKPHAQVWLKSGYLPRKSVVECIAILEKELAGKELCE